MFTFNKQSTRSLLRNCSSRNMHLFRVQYICLLIVFYGFFNFVMLCFYMKHLRDTADDDDKRRLSRIITEVCANITSRLNVFLAETSDSGGRAAWKIPRIQNVLEHEFLHFPDRKWLESYRISKDMFEQLTHDLRSLQRQVTRLRSPVPVRTVVAMLLKRLGKGLDYREIGDKLESVLLLHALKLTKLWNSWLVPRCTS